MICWAECIRKEARSASSKHAEVQLRDLVSSACENLSLVFQSKSQRKLQLSWRLTHVQCKVSERGSTSASAEAQVEVASGLKRKASDSISRSLLTEWRLCSSIHLSGMRNKKPGLSALSCTKEAFHRCTALKSAPLAVAAVELPPQAKHCLAIPLVSFRLRALRLLHPPLAPCEREAQPRRAIPFARGAPFPPIDSRARARSLSLSLSRLQPSLPPSPLRLSAKSTARYVLQEPKPRL